MPRKRRRKRKSHYSKGEYTSIKSGKTHSHRSGWELRYMQWLDSNADVKAWDYECLKIPYISNLKTKKLRTYFPDFLIDTISNGVFVIEIKPLKRTNQPKVLKKTQAAQQWCNIHGFTFKILTEIELKALGIL